MEAQIAAAIAAAQQVAAAVPALAAHDTGFVGAVPMVGGRVRTLDEMLESTGVGVDAWASVDIGGFLLNKSDVWVQNINLGLEFSY